jgi:hypothetical protein
VIGPLLAQAEETNRFALEKGVYMPAVILENAKLLGRVYCPLCTRTVEAELSTPVPAESRKLRTRVAPGQKCPRCSASLDAAFVIAN